MGRPRTRYKDMPLGMRLVDGRWYWRATDKGTRLALDRLLALAHLAPGRTGIPAGQNNADKEAARRWWVETVLPALAVVAPAELPASGTLEEILERHEREIIHTLTVDVQADHRRYVKRLRQEFGTYRYARSEAEAATGRFLRAMHLTQYLRREEQAGRPVAANREVQALSRMFHVAKAVWGLTEYNPCLQVMYNVEQERDVYRSDADLMAVYAKAPPLLQVLMDLAQMNAPRRGMLLRLNLADIDDAVGVTFTLNKKKKGAAARKQIARWVDEETGADTGLREVIDRALELRKKVRGGQSVVKDLTSAPLFLNRNGKRVTKTGFNSMWQRAARAAGFGAHQFYFHDIRAKTASEAKSEKEAQDLLGHLDTRTARAVYRRKPIELRPRKRVSKTP